MLKADALKFLTTFRSQISATEVLAAFPGLVRLLGAESNVVHSYAATCMERLLCLKVAPCPRPAPPPFPPVRMPSHHARHADWCHISRCSTTKLHYFLECLPTSSRAPPAGAEAMHTTESFAETIAHVGGCFVVFHQTACGRPSYRDPLVSV